MAGKNNFSSSKYGTNTLKSGTKTLTLTNLNGEVKEKIEIKKSERTSILQKMKELITK